MRPGTGSLNIDRGARRGYAPSFLGVSLGGGGGSSFDGVYDGSDYDVWSVNTEAEYLEEGEAVDGVLDVELVA
jgi:hypothetical protein